MKTKHIVAIIATLAVMYFFFRKDHNQPDLSFDNTNESSKEKKKSVQALTQPVANVQVGNTAAVSSGTSTSTPAVTNEQIDEVQKNFSNQLRQLGQCLAVQISPDHEKLDPKYDNLSNALTSGFGNMLVKMDDWTQWEGQTSDGSVKRIRTEVEYLENNIPTKRLQLYKLNAQGMPEMQTLDEELSLNPTDEYLDSLRSDSKTLLDEKASRGYFAEGEELVVIERNGKIRQFSMSKGEKTFSCTETDSLNSNCQCL